MTESEYIRGLESKGAKVGRSAAEVMDTTAWQTNSIFLTKIYPEISERDFQREVIAYARHKGWIVAHFRPAKTNKGWRTPVSADGKGFPDLLMVRGDRMVVCELKSKLGKMSKDQNKWFKAFALVKGHIYVAKWMPADWPEILKVLA